MAIDIDADIDNADWAKSTWDIPARDAESLRGWLKAQHITLAHFKTLPVYKLNVDKLPWLRDLATPAVRSFFNPRHDHRTGRFAPKPGGGTSVGVTPNRGPSRESLKEVEPYFSTTRYKGFQNRAQASAAGHNVEVVSSVRAAGFWEHDLEPSAQIRVRGKPSDVKAYATDLGKRYNQDAVVAFTPRKGGTSRRYRWHVDDPSAAVGALRDSNVLGATIIGKTVEVLDLDGSLHGQMRTVAEKIGHRGQVSRGVGHLWEKGTDYADIMTVVVMPE